MITKRLVIAAFLAAISIFSLASTMVINSRQSVVSLATETNEVHFLEEVNEHGNLSGYSELGYLNLTSHGSNVSYFYALSGFYNDPIINQTNIASLKNNPVSLLLYKVYQNVRGPFDNTTLQISNVNLRANHYFPVMTPGIFANGNLGLVIGVRYWADYSYLLLNPGNYTFYLNFTATAYSSIGPFNFPGYAQSFSVNWKVVVE